MKITEMSFAEGFLGIQARAASAMNAKFKVFDWNKAATIIKEKIIDHPYLIAEAGLQRDWAYTSGVIFENGKPVKSDSTFLKSNWAIPTLILSWDGFEQEEIECYVEDSLVYNAETVWPDESLKLLQ